MWLFDQPGGPPLFAFSRDDQGATVTGFLYDGENASDQPLTDVQAVLIPDRNAWGTWNSVSAYVNNRRTNPCEP